MKIKELLNDFNEFAPISIQESFDNCGLNIGNPEEEIKGVLLCIDIIPEVVQEAINKNCNLIVSHHPLIFSPLKKITNSNYIEQSIILAIKHDISIYCGHTNFDLVDNGVSYKMCEKLELNNLKILSPKSKILKKISVFVPDTHSEIVRNNMFIAGGGEIGMYKNCSFNTKGIGSFYAKENATPFIGKINETHYENETKIEMVFPNYQERNIISAILESHPYEEVAYDIISLENKYNKLGLGMIGELSELWDEKDFLNLIKQVFDVKVIKHSNLLNKKIKTVAVCGGSGASLISLAKQQKADIYISADIKYHDYFLAENEIILVDIGHFESEQYTKEIFYSIITKKNPTFAVNFSEVNTNPIKTF